MIEEEEEAEEEEEDGMPSPPCSRCGGQGLGVNNVVIEGEVLEGKAEYALCASCARAVLADVTASRRRE